MFGFGKKIRDPARGTAHVVGSSGLDGEAPTGAGGHRTQADVLVEAMRQATPADYQAAAYDPSNPLHAAGMQIAETQLGMDLDGDGHVAGAPQDLVSALERLAALHAAGALTDREFQELKRRLLG